VTIVFFHSEFLASPFRSSLCNSVFLQSLPNIHFSTLFVFDSVFVFAVKVFNTCRLYLLLASLISALAYNSYPQDRTLNLLGQSQVEATFSVPGQEVFVKSMGPYRGRKLGGELN